MEFESYILSDVIILEVFGKRKGKVRISRSKVIREEFFIKFVD